MESILRVTSAATTFNLALEGDVVAECGIIDEDYVTRNLPRVSAAIATYCSRVFARQTYEETFRLIYRDDVVLNQFPIVSITSIVEDGVALAATDYEADLASGIILRLSSDELICWQARKVVFTYIAGFLLPGQTGANLPHEIQMAVFETMRAMSSALTRDPEVVSESIPNVFSRSYRVIGDSGGSVHLPPRAINLLDNFCKARFV